MRVISWNVNGRYGPALAKQIAAVCERPPDVVALQEVRHESRRAWLEGLERAGHTHTIDSSDLLGLPSRSGREYRRIYFNLLASRWPLRRLAEHDLADVFRTLNGYLATDVSWVARRGDKHWAVATTTSSRRVISPHPTVDTCTTGGNKASQITPRSRLTSHNDRIAGGLFDTTGRLREPPSAVAR